ncbi:DNA-binding response regulator [Arthrobacter sp. TPD3018]|uniref:response regulator n=1 Tax=Bacteria TaxID=2 RepID=UPI000D51B5C1|nr:MULTISPECIES: response regulator transcription factor [Bacteria]PVE54581.1 DNA-binding response regulator [Sphingomonas sp. TPD3009]PVE54817.1 DNA-binding response regulator [Arthrobacter sp. TPD3018]PVE82600.1 DNA-binding response regulator [Sphingomonas melonis]
MESAAIAPSTILVVDDDASIRDAIADFLGGHGYAVRTARNAAACDHELAQAPVDLIVLDVMMPGEDGLSLCRRLAPAGTAILMLSALDAVTDRIVGLEVGAWDYLTKPFEPRELLARVRALLRRPGAERADANTNDGVSFAGWWLDMEQRRLRDPAGRPLLLSEGEHALLAAFVRRPGRILTRDALLDLARGLDATSYDRAIDIAVSRLRRKLGDADHAPLIETVRGVGYRFLPAVRPA